MRVLLGTDFSPSALEAGTVAALICRRGDGDLRLLHAAVRADHGWELTGEREALAAEAGRLRGLGARIAASGVLTGDPSNLLADQAVSERADLVVLGASGHRRTLLGSVAARTARESPIPVLVVRDAAPFRAWLAGERALRIVVGHEPAESAGRALAWAAELRRLGSVDLTVVHLRQGIGGPGAGIELFHEERHRLLEELRQAAAPRLGEVSATFTVLPTLGRVDRPLVLEAESLGADLLVVGSHQRAGFQRWWHGSVSHGVLHAAAMSVAVVPFRAVTD